MATANLQRNQPLARASVWFLIHATIVLAIVCFAFYHARTIDDDFNHPALLKFGLIASIALFSILGLTSSALGFLANCRSGRVAGTSALVVLVLGWTAIALCFLHATS